MDSSYSFTSEDKEEIIKAGYNPDDFTNISIIGNSRIGRKISFYYGNRAIVGAGLPFGPPVGTIVARRLEDWISGIR